MRVGANVRLFVFGCGYSARRFVDRIGHDAVEGVTTRSTAKAAALAVAGLRPFLFNDAASGEGIDGALARTTHLLVSIAPDAAGDPVLRHYRDVLERGASRLRWIGYLSTVGVYGDHGGAWVDENTPLRPVSERSVARVEAERAWDTFAETRGVPLAILRLAGIYGPGRNAFVNLREGTARRMIKPGQVFNRIHVDDIAGALALLAGEARGGVFNVADDEPAPPQDVVLHAAELAGVEPPPPTDLEAASLSPMARSFYGENKRVRNQALKSAGYEFIFRTFREGLASLRADREALHDLKL